MKRRIEITIEHERTVLIGPEPTAASWRWCEPCAATVHFAPVAHAAVVSNVPLRSIFQFVEQGRVHFLEHDRDVFVCLPSLSRLEVEGLEPDRPTTE